MLYSLYHVLSRARKTQRKIYAPIIAMNGTGKPSSIYATITARTNPPKVDLFIAVISAPFRLDRRSAIGEGYASTVNKFPFAFRFFTDGLQLETRVREDLIMEREKHKDIELIPTRGGYWLTHRYLHAMFWAFEHYDFMFFLKTDDDYFLCLNHLSIDIKHRKQEKLLYWGHFQCLPRMVAIDEGFVIVSADLAVEFIRRNNSLYCSPFGGQMIAMWINSLEAEGYNITYFPDNGRLMHYRSHLKKSHPDMCRDILGIHQAYTKYMIEYWNITKATWFKLYDFKRVPRLEYHEYCNLPKIWDWRMLIPFYRREPKPCRASGLKWPGLENMTFLAGREQETDLISQKWKSTWLSFCVFLLCLFFLVACARLPRGVGLCVWRKRYSLYLRT